MPLGIDLLWSFNKLKHNAIRTKHSVQNLDGQGALAGIKASRLWTLGLLWTVRGCPVLDAQGGLDREGVSRVWTGWRIWTVRGCLEPGRFGAVLNQLIRHWVADQIEWSSGKMVSFLRGFLRELSIYQRCILTFGWLEYMYVLRCFSAFHLPHKASHETNVNSTTALNIK